MKTDTDSVSLVVESTDGRPLRAYSHEGKTLVESHENRAYQLRVKNKTGNRVKAVIAVDSLNILTGKPASDDPNETGYILGPYAEEIFKGWRLDDNQVAAFTFVKREKSYATETGEGQGNGVIAVRVYAEKESESEKALKRLRKEFEEFKNRPRDKEYIPYPVYPSYPWWWDRWDYPYRPYRPDYTYCGGTSTMGSISNTSCTTTVGNQGSITLTAMNCADTKACSGSQFALSSSTPIEPQAFDMGSSWGELKKETVTHTTFETGPVIAELAVFYASLEGLKNLGVNVSREKAVAFPESFKRQYATPPKGWISGKA